MQSKVTSDLVMHVARASGSLPDFSLSSPFTKFCQIKQCIYQGQSGLPIGPKRLWSGSKINQIKRSATVTYARAEAVNKKWKEK